MNKRGHDGDGGGEIDDVSDKAEIVIMIVTRARIKEGDLLRERENGVEDEAEFCLQRKLIRSAVQWAKKEKD